MMLTPNTYATSEAVKRVFHSLPVPSLLVDAGCGNGFHLCHTKANRKIGIDLNMTGFSLPANKNIEAIKGDFRFMPFREGTIDCLMSLDSIEHVEEDENTIAEFHRILRIEGFLILTTPTKCEYLPAPLRRLSQLDTAKFHRKWGHAHSGYDDEEILNLLKRGNFEIVIHQHFKAMLTRTLTALIWGTVLDVYSRGKSGVEIYRPRPKGRIATALENVHDFIFRHTLAYLVKYIEERDSNAGFTHLVIARKTNRKPKSITQG